MNWAGGCRSGRAIQADSAGDGRFCYEPSQSPLPAPRGSRRLGHHGDLSQSLPPGPTPTPAMEGNGEATKQFLMQRMQELREAIVRRSDEEVVPQNLQELHDIAIALGMTQEGTQQFIGFGSRNILRQLFRHHRISWIVPVDVRETIRFSTPRLRTLVGRHYRSRSSA
jgi:hypothetical protein